MSKHEKKFIKKKVEEAELKEIIGSFKKLGQAWRRRRSKDDEIEDGIIEGPKFTIKGVTFQSKPSKIGATRAIQLYDSCWGCGDKTPGPDGKDLIGRIIYDRVKPGSAAKYAPRLGTSRESFWSSWFFGAAYNEDPAYSKVGRNGGVGYPAKKGYLLRQDVFNNPEKYKGGDGFYMTFHIKEAPIFPGDSIFHWRAESSGKGFHDIGGGGPAHMKIMGMDGAFYGGNEGHSAGKPGGPNNRKENTEGSTVGKSQFSLDGQRRLVPGQGGSDEYMAVVKKVIVIDDAIAPETTDSEAPVPDDESLQESNNKMQLAELIKRIL